MSPNMLISMTLSTHIYIKADLYFKLKQTSVHEIIFSIFAKIYWKIWRFGNAGCSDSVAARLFFHSPLDITTCNLLTGGQYSKSCMCGGLKLRSWFVFVDQRILGGSISLYALDKWMTTTCKSYVAYSMSDSILFWKKWRTCLIFNDCEDSKYLWRCVQIIRVSVIFNIKVTLLNYLFLFVILNCKNDDAAY